MRTRNRRRRRRVGEVDAGASRRKRVGSRRCRAKTAVRSIRRLGRLDLLSAGDVVARRSVATLGGVASTRRNWRRWTRHAPRRRRVSIHASRLFRHATGPIVINGLVESLRPCNLQIGIVPGAGAARRYAPHADGSSIQKSRRIYVRPRTSPQSAHLWWPAAAKLQAASVPIA